MTLLTSSAFAEGVRTMLPVAAGDLLEGAAFGTLAVAVMGHVAPVAMSVTAFSGSAQFATVSVLRADGTLAAALLAAVALNVRYLAMSAAVATAMTGSRWRRAAACLLLTDAAWGVAARGDGTGTRARLAGAGATELVAWTSGTVAGVVGGGVLADPSALGLDAAFPALFCWLLRDRLAEPGAAGAAVLGAAAALALTPVLAPGLPVLAAGLVAGAWSLRR